jgi:hypothetical protein
MIITSERQLTRERRRLTDIRRRTDVRYLDVLCVVKVASERRSWNGHSSVAQINTMFANHVTSELNFIDSINLGNLWLDVDTLRIYIKDSEYDEGNVIIDIY